MSNDTDIKSVLKFYSSGHIFYFGTANIIVCARADSKEIFCEFFVLVERPDGSFTHFGERISGSLPEREYSSLDDFISQYCIRKISGDILTDVWRIESENGAPMPIRNLSISFTEVERDFLIYVHYRDRSQLEWVRNMAKTKEILDAIRSYLHIYLEHVKIE